MAPAMTVHASPAPVSIGYPQSAAATANVIAQSTTYANAGTPFSETFPVSGGVAPFSWSLISGTLPPGLSLNGGDISGTPSGTGVFPITVQVTDALGGTDTKQWTLLMSQGLRAGWPQELQQRSYSLPSSASPIVADLDGDGRDEVIVCDMTTLYVFYPDGSRKSAALPGKAGTPVVADLDGDGVKEIIVSVGEYSTSTNSIYAFRADLTPLSGFPAGGYDAYTGPGEVSSPVVADFNNDGQLEIAVIATPNNSNDVNYGKSFLIMVDSKGNMVPGWPQVAGASRAIAGGATIEPFGDLTPPAVGDLDRNGKKQLVVADATTIKAFGADGTVTRQWEIDAAGGFTASNPILADMDGDGYLDIVVKYHSANSGNTIKVFDRNGGVLPGWPKELPPESTTTPNRPIVADIDGDGLPEIVAIAGGMWNEVHVLKGDGSYLPGWPLSFQGQAIFDCDPVVADINGDGNQEIVVTGSGASNIGNGNVFAFASDGSAVAGFPRDAAPVSDIRSAAAIGDVDGNGKLDLVVKSEDGYLYVWEMPEPGTGKPSQWPMFRHDYQLSGTWVTDRPRLAPVWYDFHSVVNGSSSAPHSFTITNPLYRDMTISSVTISGADSGMFALSSGTCGSLPVTLKPMQSCTVDVTFSPTDAGIRQATLTATAEDTGLTPVKAALTGTGNLATHLLTYTSGGGGSGTVNTSTGRSYMTSGSESDPHGTVVTLAAVPAAGSVFTGWQGACTGTGDCTVTMDDDESVRATFESSAAGVYQLTVAHSGAASGPISFGSGESCQSTTCSRLYTKGSVVKLTPELTTDAAFAGWSGCDSVSGTTCTVTMGAAKTVTASFRSIGSVAGAYAHSMALKEDGSVWAWGNNGWGQLGIGTTEPKFAPVQVPGLSDVVAISSRLLHSVALKKDGTVWTWGDNSYGQLGDGTTNQRRQPVQVNSVSGIVAVAAANHSVALNGDGTVWAWGANGCGQLGDGTTTDRSTPAMVPGLSGVVAVAAGNAHTIALKGDGSVWAWGCGLVGTTSSPLQMPGLSGIVAIAGGGNDAMALKSDGTVYSWGSNFFGEAGDGSTAALKFPASEVPALSGIAAIALGTWHSLAAVNDGTVRSWGKNDYGQLGDGSTTQRWTPVSVAGISGVVGISGGEGHSMAWEGDGTVWAWGQNGNGQLGDGTGTDRLTPVRVSNLNLLGTPRTTPYPRGGSFATAQSVTLSANKPATIYYTVDGSTPTESSPVYSGNIPVSTTTTIAFFAKDVAGNTEQVRTETYVINDLPSAVVSGTPPLFTRATTADLTVSGAGIVAYRFRIDANSYSAEIPVAAHIVIGPLGEGLHTVSVLGKDGAGAWQVLPTLASWTVDLTPPVAVVGNRPASVTAVNTASLAVSGAGVVSYKSMLDGGSFSAETPTSAAINLSQLNDGLHTVSVLGKDAAGNWQVTATTVTWRVDRTAPTTTASPGTGTVLAPFRVTLTCGDGTGSGCAGTRYCLGTLCTPATAYTGAITLNASTALRFFSTDAAGNKETVRTASYTVAPAAPTALTAISQTGPAIALSWADNSSNETGFVIERSVNGAAYAHLAAVGTNVKSYADRSVLPGNSYRYRIAAVIGSTPSAYSVSGTVPLLAPPGTVVATLQAGPQVAVTWRDLSSNETGFLLQRSANGAPFVTIAPLNANTTAYTDKNVLAGNTYRYQVASLVYPTPSAFTASASVTVPAPAPAAPAGLTATIATPTSVTLSWTDNSSNETSFAVWRSVNGAPAVQLGSIARTGTATSGTGGKVIFTDYTAKAGNSYGYYVRALNVTIPSAATPTVPVLFAAPAAPVGVTVAAVTGSTTDAVTVKWTDNATNESGFTVQRASNATFTAGLITTSVGANATSAVYNLPRRTTFYFRVRANNLVGSSAWTTPLAMLTP